MNIAEKYLEIAQEVDFIESSIKGWSMEYSQPIKGSEERRTHNALFYNKIDEDRATGGDTADKAEKREDRTERGVYE